MLKQFIITGSFLSCLTVMGCSSMTPTSLQSDSPTPHAKAQKSNLLSTQRWVATEINGFQVQLSEQNMTQTPSIQFDATTKRFSGSDGCNQITGHFSSSDHHLTLSQIATTKMMCPNANSLIATQYTQALAKTAQYRVSSQLLVLFDQNNQTLIAFKKETP